MRARRESPFVSSRVAALIKTLIFTVVVPGSVTVGVPYLLFPPGARARLGGLGPLGALLVLAGAAVYLDCAWNFAIVGLGTPAIIDPPKRLVAKGLHRRVRNPMYVGVISIVFGESILFRLFDLVAYALILCLMFHLFVVFYEEPTLRKKFGADYEEYCKAVPRWIPR
jgi:protein-S-isoprenylcysteine O-methyltransferase Ste14